jgi:hypothetical protein
MSDEKGIVVMISQKQMLTVSSNQPRDDHGQVQVARR